MIGLQILILMVWLGVIPLFAGRPFVNKKERSEHLVLTWVSGQIVLWAAFFVLSVPMILLQRCFSQLCLMYNIFLGLYALFILGFCLLGKKGGRPVPVDRGSQKDSCTRRERILWLVFSVFLVVQLVLTAVLAYEEGDDAFYMAVSTITECSDTMYRILPYTGRATGLDARHGLAPFPVWIAYLARMSGMHPITVGQVVLPIVLICMAYGIYYLIACRLFEKQREKIILFMIFVELLVVFGGYSLYSVENFLLVRASQGKAVIANIVIPFLFYLLLDKLQRQDAKVWKNWLLLTFTMMTGCLCSTMGTVLTCILLGANGICVAISYRRWKEIVLVGLCCMPPMIMAVLYFLLK